MRVALWLLAALSATSGWVSAQNVRVTTQIVEVPHGAYTEWTRGAAVDGAGLHGLSMERVGEGEARIIDTTFVTCLSGEQASTEAISELIFPTEYWWPDGWGSLPPRRLLKPKQTLEPRPQTVTAFETRNVGVTLEIRPTVEGGRVELFASIEKDDLLELTTWKEDRDMWGDASTRFPRFRTLRQSPGLDLEPGRFELVGVMNPKPVKVPAADKRWLVFVRAEVLGLPEG